jgi:hypothetical protein
LRETQGVTDADRHANALMFFFGEGLMIGMLLAAGLIAALDSLIGRFQRDRRG